MCCMICQYESVITCGFIFKSFCTLLSSLRFSSWQESSLMWKIKSKHTIRQQLFSTVTNLVSFCLNQNNKNEITFSWLYVGRGWSKERRIHWVIKMENEDVIFFHKLGTKLLSWYLYFQFLQYEFFEKLGQIICCY